MDSNINTIKVLTSGTADMRIRRSVVDTGDNYRIIRKTKLSYIQIRNKINPSCAQGFLVFFFVLFHSPWRRDEIFCRVSSAAQGEG